jgi:hypothetical protein
MKYFSSSSCSTLAAALGAAEEAAAVGAALGAIGGGAVGGVVGGLLLVALVAVGLVAAVFAVVGWIWDDQYISDGSEGCEYASVNERTHLCVRLRLPVFT